jgi:hypothetical protein
LNDTGHELVPVVSSVRQSSSCSRAETIGTAAVSLLNARRSRIFRLWRRHTCTNSLHLRPHDNNVRHFRCVGFQGSAAMCIQCIIDLCYWQGTRSCCIHEADLHSHVSPDSAVLGRSFHCCALLTRVNKVVHSCRYTQTLRLHSKHW